MASPEPDLGWLLLPERARLLHIGLMKTGTTALQNAAAASRPALLEHGVRYPGRRFNHRYPLMGLLDVRRGWTGPTGTGPTRRNWDALMREVEADDERRVLISHEHASLANDEKARLLVDALGPRTHVAVTVRGVQAVLGSAWQQYVKEGMTDGFHDWLRLVLSDDPDRSVSPAFRSRIRAGAVIDRWASLVGPERVTVVVVDRARPDLLAHAFEALLGLPRDLLAHATVNGQQANRSLTLPEAEVLRQFNLTYDRREVPWADHTALVREGALQTLLAARVPSPSEPRMPVPAWAADAAVSHSRRTAATIRETGVRVVGDLDALTAPVRTSEAPATVDQVAVDVAARLLGGMFSAARERVHEDRPQRPAATGPPAPTHGSGEQPPAVSTRQVATELRTADLAKALGISVARGLTRRISPRRR
ncbi:MAG TPA: hypothetical protein VFJ12_03025 [Segeticoccus sp.]|nr:hypothetical protein [Segeticoccus sp.]